MLQLHTGKLGLTDGFGPKTFERVFSEIQHFC